MEIFMDDFSVHGNSFDECLTHLTLVLKRCEESNLILNWEKCHFMVEEGIVLGHVVSIRGIEVDLYDFTHVITQALVVVKTMISID